jgi:rubrerythrin
VETTRRGLLLGGAAAVPLLGTAGEALAAARGDRQIVTAAIVLEQHAVAIYDAALETGRLDPSLQKIVRHLRDQEREHADGLARALRGLGGRRPPPGSTLEGFPRGHRFANFALQMEDELIAAYYEAMPRLRPGLRQPLASIMASEAQHLVVLRQALGRDPLPQAFETGDRRR